MKKSIDKLAIALNNSLFNPKLLSKLVNALDTGLDTSDPPSPHPIRENIFILMKNFPRSSFMDSAILERIKLIDPIKLPIVLPILP
ncbi:hypothetical protein, partial [Enterococcus faecium]|uniref:hypothetical protein n=1 Tax=Enterococcus faecium TaxID=1352 RepID=UPI001F2DFC41